MDDRRLAERSLVARAFEPVDPSSLAALRIAFGLLMTIEVIRFFALGWVKEEYIDPPFHFTYAGFEWVKPWPGEGMYWHFALLGLCAIGVTIGFAYRASAGLFCIGFTYVFLLEKARYLNHFYLICLLSFLVTLVPAHHAWSVDARIRGEERSVPAGAVWLLRAQIGLVYFFAGIAKLNGDWLRGEPLRMWLSERADHPLLGPVLDTEWCAYLFSYGGLALDLFAWPLLEWKRTRLVTFLVTCVFHLLNAAVFGIGIFPWMAMAVTTIFFEPDWPRRLLRRPARVYAPVAVSYPKQRAIVALAGTYIVLQSLIPRRHF